ncbi:MAG: methyltransferase domain-containing protein [bacterium]|nr:methyltransferase domain-containing protein [bacterium]
MLIINKVRSRIQLYWNLPHSLARLDEINSTSSAKAASQLETLQAIEKAQSVLSEESTGLSSRLQQLDNRLADVNHQLSVLERPGTIAGKTKNKLVHTFADDHLLDKFYIEFENKFRGPEDVIQERQKVYLPYLKGAKLSYKKFPILDIGCGRGELLELFHAQGLRAIGIDINGAMVKRASDKGLEAYEKSAQDYLANTPSGSLSAITGMHIVEHIPFPELVRIFSECYRSLRPGGLAIFETPNPETLLVGSYSFYLDPSHLHPLPPELLSFTLEFCGFHKTKILRLHPFKETSPQKSNKPEIDEINQKLYGSLDYAVIAYKT